MTTTDHRNAAKDRIDGLVALLEAQPETAGRTALLNECRALTRAISAFHMEGIRFRMFNVDRLIAKGAVTLPPDATAAFAEARSHLEAAGFHTRSHQAPG